jgi:MoaA/NifB/PqqE/SkfB family radical SAM enzyme
MFNIINFSQKYLPTSIKICLKPYFRKVFPNKRIALLWITFRCTYKCSYCPYCGIQDYSKYFSKNLEKSGEEWLAALDRLPPTMFYISGGEPFLYEDLYKIINNLQKKHSILGIVTNASMPLDVYDKVSKNIHLNVSFHSDFIDEDKFINKILSLSKKFHITINIVATKKNILLLQKYSKCLKSNNIDFHVDPIIDFVNNKCFDYTPEDLKIINKFILKDRSLYKKQLLEKSTKICSAGRNYYNIMPNGDVTICSNTMDIKYSKYRCETKDKNFELGNVFNNNFSLNNSDYKCLYKCLNHCDIDYCRINIAKN